MTEKKVSINSKEYSEKEEEVSKIPEKNAWALSIPAFSKGDMKNNLQEESKFEVTFPKYRENYIKECWPLVQDLFDKHGIKAELNLLEGIMSVATTRRTWDPYIILKTRDIIKLLSRSVPVEHAVKVIKDGITSEIIKIKNLVRNRERLIKRRERLIGSNGTALKALELLTDCYVLVQGCTVATVGPHQGVQQVIKVVLDTMRNIHPVNLLKVLMVKRTLAIDPEKKEEDWKKYIPSYSKNNVQRKSRKFKPKKPYTQFPPEIQERKEDISMASGQYFIEKEDREKQKWKWNTVKVTKKRNIEREKKRNEAFIAPKEAKFVSHAPSTNSNPDVNIKRLKKKIKTRTQE